MRKTLFLFMVFVFPFVAIAQSVEIKGIISDKDHDPIAFATVYLLNSKKGCYTNELGEFKIRLDTSEDKLLASSIGYLSDTIDVSRAIQKNISIQLQPKNYELTGIEVTAKKQKAKRFDVGFWGKKYKETLDFFSAYGDEIAVHIPNNTNKTGVIETINFTTVKDYQKKHLNQNVTVRLKLWTYDTLTKLPAENLLKNDVLVHIDKVKHKDYQVNVLSQNIILPPEGLFVGIEFLGVADIEPSMQFRVGPGIVGTKTPVYTSFCYRVFGQGIWLDRFTSSKQKYNEVLKFGLTLIEIE